MTGKVRWISRKCQVSLSTWKTHLLEAVVCEYELAAACLKQLCESCSRWLVSVLHCITVSLAKSHRYSAMPLVDIQISSLDMEVSRYGGSDLALHRLSCNV